MLPWLSNNWIWIAGIIIVVFTAFIIFLKIKLARRSLTCGSDSIACGDIIISDINFGNNEKPEWYEVLEEEMKRIPIGSIAFNPAEEMRVGVQERLEVRISKDPDTDIVSALKGRGIPQIEEIKVSELMKVQVSGSDFDIIPLNEEEQFVSAQGFTEWAWNILPQKSGNKILHLHVTLRIRLPFGEERKDHPVLDKSVTVKVNPIYSTKNFIKNYWKWILTAILLPLIGLILKTYGK